MNLGNSSKLNGAATLLAKLKNYGLLFNNCLPCCNNIMCHSRPTRQLCQHQGTRMIHRWEGEEETIWVKWGSGEKKKEGSNLEHTRGHKARSMPEESQSYRFLKNKWTDISLWSLPLITIGKRVQGGGMSVGCGRWMTGNHWAPGRNLQSLHKSRLVWAQWPQKSLWSAASQRV